MSDRDRAAPAPAPAPPPTGAPSAVVSPQRPVVPQGMKAMWRIGFAIGAALLLIAGVLAVRERQFIANSVHATGTVSRVDREWMSSSSSSGYQGSNRGGNWGYRIVASFPVSGRTMEARSASLTSYTGYKVGDPIEVIYPPGQPERAQLVRFVDRWMLVLVLAAIGGAFIAICAFGKWLTTLPGARITSSGVGFNVRSPVYSVEADLRPASIANGEAEPRSRGWPKAMVIGAVLIAGIGIGLLVADLRHPPGAAALAQPAASAMMSTPAASGSGSERPSAAGWPSNLTVEAPSMSDDQTRATTPGWTDPANGGSTRANLTMAARAFLAQPRVDAAMQSALHKQVAKLALPCPGIAFAVGETLLFPTPFPMFDAAGTMERGLVRQRFIASGCPGRSPEFNVWVFAEGNGVALRTVAGYPGTTRADLMLMNDATPVVLAIASRVSSGCPTLTIADTRLANPAVVNTEGPWREQWLVTGCGKMIAMTVDFVPDKGRGMTRIEVPEALARVLPPT